MNKRANGGDSLRWADVLAICRDQLSGVLLVPTSTIGRASSILTEDDILGVLGAPSVSLGEASSSVQASAPVS